MKKKEIFEGVVERTDYPNVGIVDVSGTPVRIKGAIPGQKLRFRINKIRKNKCEAGILEVLEDSSLESVKDVCPHFGICGGCFYGKVPYEQELLIKQDQIKRLLEPVVAPEDFGASFKPIAPSPKDSAYRNKMEFTFGDAFKGGPLCLGMHKKGAFYDIVTVEGCRLVDEDFSTILKATLNFFTERGIPYFNRMSHEGFLRHLLVRRGEAFGEILVSLVTTSEMDEKTVKGWGETIKALPVKGTVKGILHTRNDRLGDVVENQGTEILHGNDYFNEQLLSLDFKISPFSFFQTNSKGAEVLYSIVKELTPESDVVYDLYCGTGTIGQIVAEKARKVIGVEIVEEAVLAARENAGKNHIENAEFIAGDVLKVLDSIETLPDMIILDPPRDGVHPKALERILSYGVEKIIYVSCKPTSLARDTEVFYAHGYRPYFIKPVDMFPRTANVEVIAAFSK